MGTNNTSGVEITINGITYTGGDIKVVYGGTTFSGIKKFKYGSKQAKKNVMGMSREPINRIRGGFTYEASLTLLAATVDAMEAAAGGGIEGFQPDELLLVYLDESLNVIKTDTCVFAEFTGNSREVDGPDNEVWIECEMVVGGIQRVSGS